MAVDLHIIPTPDTDDLTLHFADDGPYWWLQPTFQKLAQRTGQMIDLYGDAYFTPDLLPAFKHSITEAQQQVQHKPEYWLVGTGTIVQPLPYTRVSFVERRRMLALLKQLMTLIDWALAHAATIECRGD